MFYQVNTVQVYMYAQSTDSEAVHYKHITLIVNKRLHLKESLLQVIFVFHFSTNFNNLMTGLLEYLTVVLEYY